MSKATYILVLFISVALLACKKGNPQLDPVVPPDTIKVYTDKTICNSADSTVDIAGCTSIIGPTKIAIYPIVIDFACNPANASELAIYKLYQTGNACIAIYNMLAKTSHTIAIEVNKIKSDIQWAKDGNIYFNGSNYNSHCFNTATKIINPLKIRNGQNTPRVNDSIIYSLAGSHSAGANYYYKSNWQGKVLDSVKQGAGYYGMDISTNNVFAYSNEGTEISTLSYLDGKKTVRAISSFYDVGTSYYRPVSYVKWHPNNQDIYFIKGWDHLYKVNINTKKVTLVKVARNFSEMNAIGFSPDGTKLRLCTTNTELKNTIPLDRCTWYFHYQISEMDLSGCNEKVIFKEVN